MKRLCAVGDVIKSDKFYVWRKNRDGSYHLSSGPTVSGNEWLVIETKMTGGGTGHGPHDVFPDGHEVTIQMLNYGNKPDTSLTLKFYQNGCFINMIPPENIKWIKTLKKGVTVVWE